MFLSGWPPIFEDGAASGKCRQRFWSGISASRTAAPCGSRRLVRRGLHFRPAIALHPRGLPKTRGFDGLAKSGQEAGLNENRELAAALETTARSLAARLRCLAVFVITSGADCRHLNKPYALELLAEVAAYAKKHFPG